MSWRASAWAKEQRLGSPSAKSILLCLADYADPDKAACWPSQAQLAADAEVSERTAREWLRRLEEWGLISRERRTRTNGARASDMIVLRLDMRVVDGAERCRDCKASDEEGEDGLPAEFAGRTNRQPETDPTGNEAQPTGNQCRANKEEPSIEPPIGTSQPGAQARERGDEDPKKIDADGWALLKDWPGFAGMPKEPALRVWRSLSAEDRAEAARLFPHWLALLKAQRKSHVPAPSTYFGQRLWTEVPEPKADPEKPVYAPAFGPVWGAIRMADLVTGPKAATPLKPWEERAIAEGALDRERTEREKRRRMGWPKVNAMDAAAETRGVGVTAPKPDEVALGALMEPVPVGSPLLAEWRAEFERQGWPWLPDPGRMPVIYFPAGGPATLGEFEAAIAAAKEGQPDAGGACEAAE